MSKWIVALIIVLLSGVPIQAQCLPQETLSEAVLAIFGNSRRVAQITTKDLQVLSSSNLARLYHAAPAPILDRLLNKNLPLTYHDPAAQSFLDQRSFSPQATTPGESTVGLWIRSDFAAPFRVYKVNSYFDGCPTIRLSYNLNRASESVRRGKDEVRQINANVLLGVYLQTTDLDAEGNPIKELDQINTFWTTDLQQATPWSEASVPAYLGWPWRAAKPASGTCSASWQPAFAYDTTRYPFINRCMALSLGTIHYFDQAPVGSSKGTVLMVHGNPVWSYVYRDIAQMLLAEGYRVVAMDYYGFGLSDKPSLEIFGYTPHEQAEVFEEFVELLDLKELTLMVQDWGGPIGLSMAGHFPSRVKNIVAMNTWAFNNDEIGPWGAFNTNYRKELISTAAVPRHTGVELGSLYGTKGSPEYLAVRNNYWGPFIDLVTQSALAPEIVAPTNIFPQQIFLDREFLEDTDRNLQDFVSTKPVFFVYSEQTSEFSNITKMSQRWKPDAIWGMYISPIAEHFIQEWEQEKIVEAVLFLNDV